VKQDALDRAVREHSGDFLCEQIHSDKTTKTVRFKHVITPASGTDGVPDIGRLHDFYDTFESVLFYSDERSGDAGKYIASPAEWGELQEAFSAWLDGLDEEELSECVPRWIESCLVVGETPSSGNYILMATEGPEAGHVFEFEHDGFEFNHEAADIIEYVGKLLKPDERTLTEIASHMRFVDDDPMCQWWIRELRDNHGYVVRTNA